LPLKVIWALLDIATILVLGSGLYLWLSRKATLRVDEEAEIIFSRDQQKDPGLTDRAAE
jgi:uncharacterized iron-regulated membrane protein